MKKILLHACCAVCMAYPIQKLSQNGYDVTVYFYNPNIYPESEYIRRRDELVQYCEKSGYKYIIGDFEQEFWNEWIKGLEKEPEKGKRCNLCFKFRLENTVKKALELGIPNYTTTLTVSPHKISREIFKAAEELSYYGINFIKEDFKKQNGFLKTMQIAKENNFYRQQYCGCLYSIRKD